MNKNLKTALQAALGRVSPELLQAARSLRFLRACRRGYKPLQDALAPKLYPDGDIRVLHGPFEGMKYFNRTVWGPITAKWLGTYEAELHEVMAEILKRQYATIVDVGAAEGYYAVGLARMFPKAKVYAFDTDPFARISLRRLTRINGIRNLCCQSTLKHPRLNALLAAPPSLLVCDIEGAELDLLNPNAAPSLCNADILVECHRTAQGTTAQTADEITARFSRSHFIERIGVTKRRLEWLRETLPGASALSDCDLLNAACEHRGADQLWLWMAPYSHKP